LALFSVLAMVEYLPRACEHLARIERLRLRRWRSFGALQRSCSREPDRPQDFAWNRYTEKSLHGFSKAFRGQGMVDVLGFTRNFDPDAAYQALLCAEGPSTKVASRAL